MRVSLTAPSHQLARRVPAGADRHDIWRGARTVQLWLLNGPHLAHRIEAWAHSGAALGIEYRYPLLDRRILDFACGLPPDQLIRDGVGRYLMRGAMSALLPREVYSNRDKSEPARVASSLPLVGAALSSVAELLDTTTLSPNRVACVDLPRVRERARNWTDKRGKLPPLRRALQFLDIK